MISVVLLSGGIGSRSGKNIPKQYSFLLGKRVITYCIDSIISAGLIDELVIVYGDGYLDLLHQIMEPYNNKFSRVKFVLGGASRQDSVFNGLVETSYETLILHESARPLITGENILSILNHQEDSVTMGASIPFTVLKPEKVKDIMELELLDCVTELLEKVKIETGKEVLVYENDQVSSMVEAKTATKDDDNHYIAYSPNYTPEINHLIASKAIQFLRVYRIDSSKRKSAVAYQEHLNNGKMGIALEVDRKPYLKIALNDPQLTSTWILSLVNQLISQPVNINIEREIYNNYPELRAYQLNVVKSQFDDFNLTLSKEVEEISPSIIYNSSAIMNYVYLKSIDTITGSNFISKLNYIVKGNRSETLYNYTLENLENSVESDYKVIDYWANYLNIDSWYQWV
ncbi:MAG: hypothetical protein B6229_07465 [Spirochaetaceae bacterium 4572_7]|nr:MAG: hypothetical protein B6229_07465 [Spirochaetaceae bacterium 4572_7]